VRCNDPCKGHRALLIALVLLLLSLVNSVRAAAVFDPQQAFADALRDFELHHNRANLRHSCEEVYRADPSFALALFYLGVLDEADENWAAAAVKFKAFIGLSKDEQLNEQAASELAKLPHLIKQDSDPHGKLMRRYGEKLRSAMLLDSQGFSKEAMLEVGEASQLVPDQWQAYAMASEILVRHHNAAKASEFLALAKDRSPASASKQIGALARAIKNIQQQ
jgi:hypothetical protein